MSHRFKPPKTYVKMGSVKARLIKAAGLIQNQEQLDKILREAPKEIGLAWLEMARPYLKFMPRQFMPVEKVQVGQTEEAPC